MALPLTTAHGFTEARADREDTEMREQYRSRLLLDAFPNSALQRLCRKAGVESASTGEKNSAYHSLRVVADVILFNLLKSVVILAQALNG